MKLRWYHGLAALIVVVGAFAYVQHRRTVDNVIPPPVHWQTRDPLIYPVGRALVLKPPATARTRAFALPAGQLPTAEWYLPIAPHSAVSFILHDGRGRWVFQGRRIALINPPIDPADQLNYNRTGSLLAWVRPGGGAAIQTPTAYHTIPDATAIAINAENHLVWIQGHQVIEDGKTLRWTFRGALATTHPFIDHAQTLVTDWHGRILAYQLATGQAKLLVSVRPNRWPTLVTVRHIRGGTALLLERNTAVPRYLLVLADGQNTGWYRFVSATPPELGAFRGQLVINNITAAGNLAVVTTSSLVPLTVVPGIFSSGPYGVLWAGSHGFVQLLSWTS
ncbi:MAG: hypothetical protein OWU33_08930 [Firmicutes bacterium]|nr:hypothetical protein [Bacillota bacterium]